ncbi:hypothetical protein [Tepidimonas sp.]|uniref:hypothetical protein n=1 Tax=Tepidimonas sp. TaxID=2002775 RepID=UPI00391A3082
MPEKQFNTADPSGPELHYVLDPLARIDLFARQAVAGACRNTCTRAWSRKPWPWHAGAAVRRLHSSLGDLSPMQFEQRWHEAQRNNAA